MLNKKYLFIALAVIIIISSVLLFFLLRNISNNKNNKIAENISPIDQLKSNHPEFSSEQLKFYSDTAAAKTGVAPCLGRADENNCIASIAFINNSSNLCHDLEHKSGQLYKQCVSPILNENAQSKISQCQALSGDDYYNCLEAVFSVYTEPGDCAGLKEAEAQAICGDILNFRVVYSNYDRTSCDKIKTEKLNQYCLKVIIDKNQDTDGDGLSDLDEINKYKTHYLFADTDNDGLSDGDEINKYKTDPKDPKSK